MTAKENLQTEGRDPFEGYFGLVYARVSSKKQESEGSGLQSQEGRCVNDLRFIGVPHIKTFPDTFTGGGDFMKRPAMREMLAFIDSNPHKKFVVVFDDLKRFARDVHFHFKLKAAFKSRGVLLRCLNFNFEDSPEGEYVETIMAAGSQLERKQNGRQVVQKQKARLELGYWPFVIMRGYRFSHDPAHGKIAVPNEKDKDILIEALEGFANGTFSRKTDACRFLVERGFWHSPVEKIIVQFSKILTNSFYAGFVEYKPWEVSRRPGKHEALISEETFNLIQKRLQNNGRNKNVRVDVSADFPLRGLVLCSYCQVPLTAAWSTGGRKKLFPYYICRHKTCDVYGKSIKKKEIEPQFGEMLMNIALKNEIGQLVTLVFDTVWKEEVRAFQNNQKLFARQANEKKQKIRDLADMAIKARSEAVRIAYESQIEELSAEGIASHPDQVIDLAIPYRTALEKSITLLKNPYSVWGNAPVLEKHRLFFLIFDTKIGYSKKEGFRTAEIVSVSSLFQGFINENKKASIGDPLVVDLSGIEPLTF